MMIHAEVWLWNSRIGVVGMGRDGRRGALFEYDQQFVEGAKGIEPAPLKMPRRSGVYSFERESERTFRGLPGMFVDSLPDKFGTSLLDRWFTEQGRNPADINVVERLLYIADRGMGALTYRPARNLVPLEKKAGRTALDLGDLAALADAVLKKNESFHEALSKAESSQAALDLIRVGTSAGGARAKAVVAESPEGVFIPGHTVQEKPYRYWLLKFDGITGNADRDGGDPPGMTLVEYAYSRIARKAGINLPETRLAEDGERRHFLIERFDRINTGEKTDRLHYASWCGLDHAHRDWPGAYGYEQLALACRRLGLSHEDMEQLFLRAVYNIVGVNHDDHSKNFGFLMDRRGEWRLSPAFDLTYSCDPAGRWTKEHQTALNGKTAGHSMNDLLAFASHCDLTARDARLNIERIRDAFSEWPSLASELDIPRRTADTITLMLGKTAEGLDA